MSEMARGMVNSWGGSVRSRYVELINPGSVDERTGDEIAEDIIARAGLSFGGDE